MTMTVEKLLEKITEENADGIFEDAERLIVEAVTDPTKIPQSNEATSRALALEGPSRFKRRTKMTQLEKILNHIEKNGSITQREAYLDYSIQSFHRRIADLRASGHDIVGVQKFHPTTGQEYTRYYLGDPE